MVDVNKRLHQVGNSPEDMPFAGWGVVDNINANNLVDTEDFGGLGEEMEDEEDILRDADETNTEAMLRKEGLL